MQRVVDRVGVAGAGSHRRATPAVGLAPGQVDVHLLRSAVQEAAYVAGELRRAHLERDVPWGEMAVIVRGTGRAATMRRVLATAGVPVQVPATELPVRDASAVVPLLDAFAACLDPSALDVELALRLLTSPIGGADAVAVRRLRRALRAEEREGGGGRISDELLVEAVAEVDRVETLPSAISLPARRVARVLAAGRGPRRRRTRRREQGERGDRALGDLGGVAAGRAVAANGARRWPVRGAGRP